MTFEVRRKRRMRVKKKPEGPKKSKEEKLMDLRAAQKEVQEAVDVGYVLPPVVEFIQGLGRVILSFSCGKDSLACWCALHEMGVEVRPFYLQLIPGLSWIEDYLKYMEDHFGVEILRCAHPLTYHYLRTYSAQPPHRKCGIDLLDLVDFDYEDVERGVRRTLAMRTGDDFWKTAWVAVGTKITDNPIRRRAFALKGWKRPDIKKVFPIFNLKKDEMIALMNRNNVRLSECYRMYARSFEGIDFRYIHAIKEDKPEDYQKLLEWFPLAEAEFWKVKWACDHGIGRTT